MVGFSSLFERVKMDLMERYGDIFLFKLVGMPGSGKTTLAQNLFEDPAIVRWFDYRVWITVGRRYKLNEIERQVLAQLNPQIDEIIPQAGDKGKHKHLNRVLRWADRRLVKMIIRKYLSGGKRFLIVLDNIWDTEVIDYFKTLLQVESDVVIQILLTTNQDKIAQQADRIIRLPNIIYTYMMEPLNEKESEELLRIEVFGEEVEDFPPRLEKPAKKIAKNCKGLPLMIVMVADLLSKANKNDDPEFWSEVAENPYSDVMMEAHNQISKVLFPAYDCFPQSTKMFYLYMAAFPQDYNVPASKLINILTVEGFLKPKTLHNFFHWRGNLAFMASTTVLISQKKSTDYQVIKTLRLNSSWSYLFNKESCKDKFLLLLNSGVVDALEQHMKGQRRLCLNANFVLNFKEVYNSVKFDCASTMRSLLCFGPYHPYSMPLDFDFKLLRVLDALKVRFYSFPAEILELVLLQYLALTYNGELPISISKLFNLQFLIIHPHVSIKYRGVTSYVPVQIWDMQELKHIEILGNNLPNDPNSASSLQKLYTLLGVNICSCTSKVLERLPYIRKLGIQIELTPSGDDDHDLNFGCIWKLKYLEVLKCSSIVHPEVKYGCVAPQKPLSMFPSSLRKLHLSGLGYPWKYMKAIGEIPNLHVLKLRCYAFKGPKWETENKSFLHLKYLVIEDTDLVQWKLRYGTFPELRKLRMKHCYKLHKFDWPCDLGSGRIELVDCNPLAVTCAKQLKFIHPSLQVNASFDGKELN
ncbi:hypothetical protein C2S53_013488 [Perilla frutescens var. hirtella]|uniref:NB-ARC domain-containing protein n=1 Tax=Perilla frutescens var. hirtella TaxID=608512 RepID=A0AAD4J8R2_PERFH|nr:hypothetical protein C2S53_013488 [Perilla frutescens var. hirtella]